MTETVIRDLCWVLSMMALLLPVACSTDDSIDGPQEVKTVSAQYTFALPKRIAGIGQKKASTRMTPDVVQEDETEASFRGIDDIHLFCFDNYPTQQSSKLGSVIELKTTESAELEETTDADYSLTQEVRIPIGTNYFAFYARAADAPRTHEERMHYGVIETVGLDRNSYTDNSSIRFRPVPICTSTDALGGSQRGHALLDLLNDLLNINGPEAAPNNRWATANNLYLNEAYKTLTAMRTLSSYNVQYMLGFINKLVNQEGPDEQGAALAAAITAKIADCCETPPATDQDVITLKEEYQGFPEDIHLPAGAARIVWNEAQSRFEIPDVQAYGKGLDILSLNDYAYPMNLQYQIFSDILASDSLVLKDVPQTAAGTPASSGGDPQTAPADSTSTTKSWQELLDSAYLGASRTVRETTQSVAMVQQVQYAVGRLALRTRITTDNIYDAHGQLVNVTNGFTLKGYIVGGQREVDYNFQPVESGREYAIYDTDLNGGPQHVVRRYWTDYNYILGLGTPANKDIYLAMELENNGDAFWGADGLIVHGATFYLVAAMVPSEGSNYTLGSLEKIFNKDYATRVNLTVLGGWPDKNGDGVPDPDLDNEGNPLPLNGLATATYGLPDMQIPHPTVGLSVDLSWGEGLYYEEIEL